MPCKCPKKLPKGAGKITGVLKPRPFPKSAGKLQNVKIKPAQITPQMVSKGALKAKTKQKGSPINRPLKSGFPEFTKVKDCAKC